MASAVISAMVASTAWSAPFYFGAGIHAGQNKIDAQETMLLMDQTGINSFRDEVFWHRLEIEKGVLKFPTSLVELDKLTTATNNAGKAPLLILDYGNKFYDLGDIPTSATGINGFTRYAKFVAEHFKNRSKHYEVWNEWNIGMGSNQKPRTIKTVKEYINILRPTITAVKGVDPSAKIIAGSVNQTDDKWINDFLAQGGLQGVDGFSVHPYVFTHVKENRPEDISAWLADLSKRLNAANQGRPMDIYVTEVGWPNQQGTTGWSERQTANFLLRLYILGKSQPNVRGLWWYELRDSGDSASDREHNFGMASKRRGAKPALEAMTTAVSILSESTSIKINQPVKGVYRAAIASADQQCTGYWTREGSASYKIPNADQVGEVRWGRITEAQRDEGNISETPFITCRKNK